MVFFLCRIRKNKIVPFQVSAVILAFTRDVGAIFFRQFIGCYFQTVNFLKKRIRQSLVSLPVRGHFDFIGDAASNQNIK